MYEVPKALEADVRRFGLERNIAELRERGYTVLRGCAPDEFNERLRAAILRRTASGTRPGFCLITGRPDDDVFIEAVCNPKLVCLAGVMCGLGCTLSQTAGSAKRAPRDPRNHGMGLHSDQNWTPAPFPEHNVSMTCCWATDEFTVENGATRIVAGSHRLRRHPTAAEAGRVTDTSFATAVEAPANSIVCWDGAVWHTGGHRTTPGHRVVLHTTYARLDQRPIDEYGHITEEVIERAAPDPTAFRVLLGRMGYFNRTAARFEWKDGEGAGNGLFGRMLRMVKGTASRELIRQTAELARGDPSGTGNQRAADAARIRELEAEVARLRARAGARL